MTTHSNELDNGLDSDLYQVIVKFREHYHKYDDDKERLNEGETLIEVADLNNETIAEEIGNQNLLMGKMRECETDSVEILKVRPRWKYQQASVLTAWQRDNYIQD